MKERRKKNKTYHFALHESTLYWNWDEKPKLLFERKMNTNPSRIRARQRTSDWLLLLLLYCTLVVVPAYNDGQSTATYPFWEDRRYPTAETDKGSGRLCFTKISAIFFERKWNEWNERILWIPVMRRCTGSSVWYRCTYVGILPGDLFW
jgi:hypothetical protein